MQQYTPKMEVRRTIPVWEAADRSVRVCDILWLSTFEVAVTYAACSAEDPAEYDSQASLVIVHLPSAKEPNKQPCWRYYEDPSYGSSSTRLPQSFMTYLEKWNLFVFISASSAETAVLGKNKSTNIWEIWNLDDACRAQLPYGSAEEPFPVGMGAILNAKNRIVLDNTTGADCGPMPVLAMLSSDGQLCLFHSINLMPESEYPNILSDVKPLPAGDGRVMAAKMPAPQCPAPSSGGGMAKMKLTAKPSLHITTSTPKHQPSKLQTSDDNFQTSLVESAPSQSNAAPLMSASPPFSTPLSGAGRLASESSSFPPPASSTSPSVDKPMFGGNFGSRYSAGSVAKPTEQASAPKYPSTPALKANAGGLSPFGGATAALQAPGASKFGDGFSSGGKKVAASGEPSFGNAAVASSQHVEPAVKRKEVTQPTSKLTSNTSDRESGGKSRNDKAPAKHKFGKSADSAPRSRLASETGQQIRAPAVDGSALRDGLKSEISDFQRELAEFFRESAPVSDKIGSLGSQQDKVSNAQTMEKLHVFGQDIAQTTASQHDELQSTTNACLEAFATLQKAEERKARAKNASFRKALYSRPLDLANQKKIKELRRMYQYVKDTVREADGALNEQWQTLLNKQKAGENRKSRRRVEMEGRNVVHKAVVNQTKILHDQELKLTLLGQKLERLRVESTVKWQSPELPSSRSKQSLGNSDELRTLASVLIRGEEGQKSESEGASGKLRGPDATRLTSNSFTAISPAKARQLGDWFSSRKHTSAHVGRKRTSRIVASGLLSSRVGGRDTLTDDVRHDENASVESSSSCQSEPATPPSDSKLCGSSASTKSMDLQLRSELAVTNSGATSPAVSSTASTAPPVSSIFSLSAPSSAPAPFGFSAPAAAFPLTSTPAAGPDVKASAFGFRSGPVAPATTSPPPAFTASATAAFAPSPFGTSTIKYGDSGLPHQHPSSVYDATVTQHTEASSNLNNPPLVVNIQSLKEPPVVNLSPFVAKFEAKPDVPIGAAVEVQKILNAVVAEKNQVNNLATQRRNATPPPSTSPPGEHNPPPFSHFALRKNLPVDDHSSAVDPKSSSSSNGKSASTTASLVTSAVSFPVAGKKATYGQSNQSGDTSSLPHREPFKTQLSKSSSVTNIQHQKDSGKSPLAATSSLEDSHAKKSPLAGIFHQKSSSLPLIPQQSTVSANLTSQAEAKTTLAKSSDAVQSPPQLASAVTEKEPAPILSSTLATNTKTVDEKSISEATAAESSTGVDRPLHAPEPSCDITGVKLDVLAPPPPVQPAPPSFTSSESTATAAAASPSSGDIFKQTSAVLPAATDVKPTAPMSAPTFGAIVTTSAENSSFGRQETAFGSSGTGGIFGTQSATATSTPEGARMSPEPTVAVAAEPVFGSSTGGSFLSGLGATPSSNNANPFASGNQAQSIGGDTGKSLFGNANASSPFGKSTGGFGQQSLFGQPASSSFGQASTAFGQPASSGFGFASPQAEQNSGLNAFSKPAAGGFGSPPVFGASPVGLGFGSKPVFGQSAGFGSGGGGFGMTSSASSFGNFGSNSSSGAGAGFSAFASNDSPGFGSLAASASGGFGSLAQSNQQPSFGSGFGSSSGFGSAPNQPSFGVFGAQSPSGQAQPKPSSFTGWR